MLNQRTIRKGFAGEPPVCTVPGDPQLPDIMVRWADRLRGRGLGEVGMILTQLMKVWGFAGSQVLWMAAPFVTHTALASVATVLESPEMLDQLHTYLAADLEVIEYTGGST